MVIKIKRKDCLGKYPAFPISGYDEIEDEELFTFPKISKSYILTLPSKTFKGLSTQLGKEVTRLVLNLGYDSLIFMGDSQTSWRYQDNNYKAAKEALEFLHNNNIGKRFNGAIMVTVSELPLFIRHLS